MYTAVPPAGYSLRSRGGVGAQKTKDPLYVPYNMPKELGQIHTVNKKILFNGVGDIGNIDLPLELSRQLQRMIRQGNMFKVVGVDLSLSNLVAGQGGQVSGKIRYFAPTRGRCEAYRSAFAAMRNAMTNQGISNLRDNAQYDFRVKINDETAAGTPVVFANQATLDGTNGLCLVNSSVPTASVFDIHNRMVAPITDPATPVGDLFASGYNTLGVQATPTDFVLNDTIQFTGNHASASTEMEFIPFTMSWTPGSTDIATNFQWRPDPALYLAIMTGQFQVFFENVDLDSGAAALELNVSVMVSGWKSIMGNPDNKTRRSRKKK